MGNAVTIMTLLSTDVVRLLAYGVKITTKSWSFSQRYSLSFSVDDTKT